MARLPLSLLAAGRDSGKTEADEVTRERRRAIAAVRRYAAGAVEAPAAPPVHPIRALRIEQVFAPVKYIAMHVVQPQLIWCIRTDLGRPFQERTLVCLACRIVAIEVGLCR